MDCVENIEYSADIFGRRSKRYAAKAQAGDILSRTYPQRAFVSSERNKASQGSSRLLGGRGPCLTARAASYSLSAPSKSFFRSWSARVLSPQRVQAAPSGCRWNQARRDAGEWDAVGHNGEAGRGDGLVSDLSWRMTRAPYRVRAKKPNLRTVSAL